MTERQPEPSAAHEVIVRPPYEQMSAGLEQLLGSFGWSVREDVSRSMPRGTISTSSSADMTITLHPWISPRGRTEVLLSETTRRLIDKQGATQRRKRGTPATAEPRGWRVQGLVGRHVGMETDTAHVSAAASWEPTPAETLLVKQIVGAIDGAETDTNVPDIHSPS